MRFGFVNPWFAIRSPGPHSERLSLPSPAHALSPTACRSEMGKSFSLKGVKARCRSVSHKVSVTTAKLCCYGTKASTDEMETNRHGGVPIKLYLCKETAGYQSPQWDICPSFHPPLNITSSILGQAHLWYILSEITLFQIFPSPLGWKLQTQRAGTCAATKMELKEGPWRTSGERQTKRRETEAARFSPGTGLCRSASRLTREPTALGTQAPSSLSPPLRKLPSPGSRWRANPHHCVCTKELKF